MRDQTFSKNVKNEKLEGNLIKNEKSEIQIIPSEQNKPQLQTNHSNQTSSLEKLDIENPKRALTSPEKTSTSVRQDFENDEKSLKQQKEAKDSEKIESSKMPISNSAPGLCTSFSPASIAKQLSLPSCPPSSLPRNENRWRALELIQSKARIRTRIIQNRLHGTQGSGFRYCK